MVWENVLQFVFPIQFFYWKIRSHWKCAAHSAYTRYCMKRKVRSNHFFLNGRPDIEIQTHKIYMYMYTTLWNVCCLVHLKNFFLFCVRNKFLCFSCFFLVALYFRLLSNLIVLEQRSGAGNWQLASHFIEPLLNCKSFFCSLSVFIWKLYFLANILLRCHSMIICMYTYVF